MTGEQLDSIYKAHIGNSHGEALRAVYELGRSNALKEAMAAAVEVGLTPDQVDEVETIVESEEVDSGQQP